MARTEAACLLVPAEPLPPSTKTPSSAITLTTAAQVRTSGPSVEKMLGFAAANKRWCTCHQWPSGWHRLPPSLPYHAFLQSFPTASPPAAIAQVRCLQGDVKGGKQLQGSPTLALPDPNSTKQRSPLIPTFNAGLRAHPLPRRNLHPLPRHRKWPAGGAVMGVVHCWSTAIQQQVLPADMTAPLPCTLQAQTASKPQVSMELPAGAGAWCLVAWVAGGRLYGWLVAGCIAHVARLNTGPNLGQLWAAMLPGTLILSSCCSLRPPRPPPPPSPSPPPPSPPPPPPPPVSFGQAQASIFSPQQDPLTGVIFAPPGNIL